MPPLSFYHRLALCPLLLLSSALAAISVPLPAFQTKVGSAVDAQAGECCPTTEWVYSGSHPFDFTAQSQMENVAIWWNRGHYSPYETGILLGSTFPQHNPVPPPPCQELIVRQGGGSTQDQRTHNVHMIGGDDINYCIYNFGQGITPAVRSVSILPYVRWDVQPSSEVRIQTFTQPYRVIVVANPATLEDPNCKSYTVDMRASSSLVACGLPGQSKRAQGTVEMFITKTFWVDISTERLSFSVGSDSVSGPTGCVSSGSIGLRTKRAKGKAWFLTSNGRVFLERIHVHGDGGEFFECGLAAGFTVAQDNAAAIWPPSGADGLQQLPEGNCGQMYDFPRGSILDPVELPWTKDNPKAVSSYRSFCWDQRIGPVLGSMTLRVVAGEPADVNPPDPPDQFSFPQGTAVVTVSSESCCIPNPL